MGLASRGLSVGVFLAAIHAVSSVGKEVNKLVDALIKIQLSLSALLKVAFYMDLPSEVPERI